MRALCSLTKDTDQQNRGNKPDRIYQQRHAYADLDYLHPSLMDHLGDGNQFLDIHRRKSKGSSVIRATNSGMDSQCLLV